MRKAYLTRPGAPLHLAPFLGFSTMANIIEALFLGLIEGLTEFLPVSSTGHLLLVGHFLGFESTGKTFEVLIQLGAILAILSVYFNKLWSIAKALPYDPMARHFVVGVLVAFLPAAIIGAALHGFIKEVLFNPWIVCATLIVGRFVLLAIDRMLLDATKTDATRFPPSMYCKLGI